MKWIAILCLATVASGAEKPGKISPAVEKAVSRGISYLVSQQQTNGVFGQQHPHAMTSLSLLAMAAVGHRQTDDTPAGRAMAKGLEYILKIERKENDGYYGGDSSNMYGHGITTLMLAEMVGMGTDAKQDELIRQRCQKGIDLIVRSQQVKKQEQLRGGWRYAPTSADADLSVTVWQVMALRAAKNAGLTVPADTITNAIAYVKRSYYSKRNDRGRPVEAKSSFGYIPGSGPTYSTASEGLLALQVCGDYDAPELEGTVAWLSERKPKQAEGAHFYYGTYYYAQGMYQRGGAAAEEARQLVENLLVPLQSPAGSWQGAGGESSPLYATAMALMSLSVRHHFMPIYQR